MLAVSHLLNVPVLFLGAHSEVAKTSSKQCGQNSAFHLCPCGGSDVLFCFFLIFFVFGLKFLRLFFLSLSFPPSMQSDFLCSSR